MLAEHKSTTQTTWQHFGGSTEHLGHYLSPLLQQTH